MSAVYRTYLQGIYKGLKILFSFDFSEGGVTIDHSLLQKFSFFDFSDSILGFVTIRSLLSSSIFQMEKLLESTNVPP